MTATCRRSERLGIPLRVLDAVITDLEGHPDMQWIIGEPVSSGLLLVAEGDQVRIRPAPDVTFVGDDRERVLRILDTTLAADTAWPPRSRQRQPADDGPASREHVASLGKHTLSLAATKWLIRDVAQRAELRAVLGTDPRAGLLVAADGDLLTLDATVPHPLTEEQREELERTVRDVTSKDLG